MSLLPGQSTFARIAPAIFVFLWSTGFVGARFGLPYAEPMTFTSIRFAIVVVLLSVIVAFSRNRLPRSPTMCGHLAVSGILIHACYIGGVFIAIDVGVDISIAAIIVGAQPLLTAVVVVLFLGETLSRRQWAGFVVGFLGLVMVVAKTFAIGALPLAGLAGCSVVLCGITFGTLYQKRYVVGIDLLGGSVIQFAAALIPCVLWAVLSETLTIEWNVTVTLTMVWLCLALSIGAITILLFLIREGAAARVSSLFYLVPPVTALQGYWLFGENLTAGQVAGIGMAVFGVALSNTGGASPGNRI